MKNLFVALALCSLSSHNFATEQEPENYQEKLTPIYIVSEGLSDIDDMNFIGDAEIFDVVPFSYLTPGNAGNTEAILVSNNTDQNFGPIVNGKFYTPGTKYQALSLSDYDALLLPEGYTLVSSPWGYITNFGFSEYTVSNVPTVLYLKEKFLIRSPEQDPNDALHADSVKALEEVVANMRAEEIEIFTIQRYTTFDAETITGLVALCFHSILNDPNKDNDLISQLPENLRDVLQRPFRIDGIFDADLEQFQYVIDTIEVDNRDNV